MVNFVQQETPGPSNTSSIAPNGYTPPANGTEQVFAEALASVVGEDRVSVDSHFFTDLGANSLVMAQFCARVRKRLNMPSVSIKDVYRNPTIRTLAAAVDDDAQVPAPRPASEPRTLEPPVGKSRYLLCGLLQFLAFIGYSYLAAVIVVYGIQWVSAGASLLEMYLRLVLFAGVSFLGLCTLPIVAKWVLIGRWKPGQQIRVWSLQYFRFWLVKTLVQRNLVVLLFLGSPLYVLYLKALGAKIGRGVAIFSRNAPVCTDLLTIGDAAVIRKDSFFSCYRAHAGVIQTGRVTLGADALVGELTVLDIDTRLGAAAQLGHASSLHAGQVVPDGEAWNGSPAQRAEVSYRFAGPARCGSARRVMYAIGQLVSVLLVYLPLTVAGVDLLLDGLPQLTALLGTPPLAFTNWAFYGDALGVSFVVFFGAVLLGLLLVGTVPRLFNLAIKPGKDYRLYGFRYTLHRAIRVITNLKFFITLFGDSSYIVPYLRYLGYQLTPVEQTGSNFGLMVKHETPFHAAVGTGTMISDGLSIINADFSSTSFRICPATIGRHNFLGNYIGYPAQSRAGEDLLLATKVMIPVSGEIRQQAGLLGSPSFRIPRTVERDHRFDHLRSGDEFRRALAGKNRHNAATITMFLLVRWIHFFWLILLGWATTILYYPLDLSVIVLASVLSMAVSVMYFNAIERASTAFRRLRPLYCSIYDVRFWRHERFWKLSTLNYIHAFNGTPFKNVFWRMLGVRIGRKVFDDGCTMPEKTSITIGDHVTLNADTRLQGHSQEDGTFKRDAIVIGAGCTVGVSALVHYGVTMGEGTVVGPSSFVMKGEETPPNAHWSGNPAREIRTEQLRPV